MMKTGGIRRSAGLWRNHALKGVLALCAGAVVALGASAPARAEALLEVTGSNMFTLAPDTADCATAPLPADPATAIDQDHYVHGACVILYLQIKNQGNQDATSVSLMEPGVVSPAGSVRDNRIDFVGVEWHDAPTLSAGTLGGLTGESGGQWYTCEDSGNCADPGVQDYISYGVGGCDIMAGETVAIIFRAKVVGT